MTLLLAIALLVDWVILATYGRMAVTGKATWFHAANAFGAIPLVIYEVSTGAWGVMPLTVSFGALGALGLIRKDSNGGQ